VKRFISPGLLDLTILHRPLRGDYFRLMIDLRKQFVGVFNDDEFEDIVSGIKKPSEKRTQQIIGTIRRLGREMASI